MAAVFLLNACGFLLLGNRLQIPTDTQNIYSPAAVSLATGKDYTVAGKFQTQQPPFFPALLACIYWMTGQAGTENSLYPWVAMALQGLSCGLLYLIARFFVRERTAVAAAVLFAAYPFFAVLGMTKYAWNSMTLFIPIFFSAVYFYLKAMRGRNVFYVLSGFLLGAAALVWPGGAGAWGVLSGHALFAGSQPALKKAAGIILLTAAFWLLPAVWHGYAYQKTGKHIWFSGNQVASMADGLLRHEGSKLRRFHTVDSAITAKKEGKFQTPGDFVLFYARQAVQEPAETFRFLIYKALRAWYGTDSEKHEKPIAVLQLFYLLAAGCGLWFCARENPARSVLIVALVVYFWVTAFSVLSILRYMIPAMGLLMIFTAAGAAGIYKGLLKR